MIEQILDKIENGIPNESRGGIKEVGEKITIFCTRCGQRLIHEKTEIIRYDQESGRPIPQYVYVCPMKSKFWGGFFSEHDRAWFKYYQDGKLGLSRKDDGLYEFDGC